MNKQFFDLPDGDEWLSKRAFSSAVVTNGGKTAWLAGHIGTHDENGQLLASFDDQVRQTFKNIESTLARVGGDLTDMVTMTVYILDQTKGDRFVEMRAEILKKNFPCSALITVSAFANPHIMIEIMPVAVIDTD